jgi:hypothetical protein
MTAANGLLRQARATPEERSHNEATHSPFAQRVAFAPKLHRDRAETILILECGHSTDWGARTVPAYIVCLSCRGAASTSDPPEYHDKRHPRSAKRGSRRA